MVVMIVVAAWLSGRFIQDDSKDGISGGDGFIYNLATVEDIDILILESFPVQVTVAVKGYLADGCTQIDAKSPSQEFNQAHKSFMIVLKTQRPEEAICTQALVPFTKNIKLENVVGLLAGTYTVSVNGVSETFTLEMDNVLR